MRFPAVALFERALRLESRSALVAWSRVGLLVILLLFLYPIQQMAGYGRYGAAGLRFLQEMAWANLVLITLAGTSYFASAITEEKEEMTLGLLRMTDLSPVAILLGKSTSRLVGALLLLLVQVPFILLAVALGGVGLLQVIAAYGTLLAYLFLVCNLALLFSVVFRNSVIAGIVTFLTLFFFLVGHFWVGAIQQSMVDTSKINPNHAPWPLIKSALAFWRDATAPVRLGEIFQTGFNGPAFGTQVISNIAFGTAFFFIGWLVFDWCTREEKDPTPSFRFAWRRRASRPSRIPAGLFGPRALTWKDFTFISGGVWGLAAKAGVLIILVVICNVFAVQTQTKLTPGFEGGVLIWVTLLSTALWLAIEAGRIFRDEIRWKTLSALGTLPISIRELAYRKVAGALAGTLPLLGFFVIGVLLVPEDVSKFLTEMFSEGYLFGTMLVMFLQYILFLHLTAFLSLILKRGALPLAIAIQYIGGSFCFGIISVVLVGGAGPGGAMFFTALGCAGGIVGLHVAIGSRLERVMAES